MRQQAVKNLVILEQKALKKRLKNPQNYRSQDQRKWYCETANFSKHVGTIGRNIKYLFYTINKIHGTIIGKRQFTMKNPLYDEGQFMIKKTLFSVLYDFLVYIWKYNNTSVTGIVAEDYVDGLVNTFKANHFALTMLTKPRHQTLRPKVVKVTYSPKVLFELSG